MLGRGDGESVGNEPGPVYGRHSALGMVGEIAIFLGHSVTLEHGKIGRRK